jgi:LysR family glycine cleavage system transcriptional activator
VLAADELHVTPAAISHQIKRLEAYLGVQLFQRLARGLLLTDAGKLLLPDLRAVFTQLDVTMERVIERDSRGALAISVAPVFAVKWLLPRMQRFAELYPDIDVRMSSNLRLVDFHRESFDLAIRLGRGRYAGLESVKLFDESVTPMCSPRLTGDSRPIEKPDDLENFVLLHDDSMKFDADAPTWETWLAAAGATRVSLARGPRFSQPDHALQAAVDGVGITLGWQRLAAGDVGAGRLVEPFELSLPLLSSFYLVYPPAHAARAKIAAFRDWLLVECKRV